MKKYIKKLEWIPHNLKRSIWWKGGKRGKKRYNWVDIYLKVKCNKWNSFNILKDTKWIIKNKIEEKESNIFGRFNLKNPNSLN